MKLYIYAMAIMAVLAMSCGKGENKEVTADSAVAAITDVNTEMKGAATAAGDTLSNIADTTVVNVLQGSVPQPAAPVYGSPAWDRKMVKTADITVQVNSYDSFDNALHRQLSQYGAWISQEKQTGSGATVENDVTVKVPVYQFENVISSFTGKGVVVKSKEVSAVEVTAELQDTKARIAARKLVRERYMELMGRANKMKDVLTVQQELNALQENIEATQGKVNYMEDQATYSTIHLKYYRVSSGDMEDGQPLSFLAEMLNEFERGASVLGNIMLFILGIWPLTVLGAIVWVMYKKKWGSWKGDKSV